jgi:hypothetical protein
MQNYKWIKCKDDGKEFFIIGTHDKKIHLSDNSFTLSLDKYIECKEKLTCEYVDKPKNPYFNIFLNGSHFGQVFENRTFLSVDIDNTIDMSTIGCYIDIIKHEFFLMKLGK